MIGRNTNRERSAQLKAPSKSPTQVARTMEALQSSILRPFGRFRPLDQSDLMPPTVACVRDSMVSLLSSRGDKRLKTRAVLTQSSLFLSKSKDLSLVVHRIPLHEITKIARIGHDEGGRKHEALPHKPRDVAVKNFLPEYQSDSHDSETDDARRNSHAILVLNTVENGYNFGRIYTLQFKDDIMMEDWNKELQALRRSATRSYNRRTFISRRQRQIRAFYEDQYVQYAVAFLIIANFFIEATSLQFNYEYDTEQAHFLRQIDILFTMVFLLELLVNMVANLVVRFFNSAWNLFDVCIVCISLLSLGSAEMDFVKGARILRVFRVLRAFGRIQSLRGLINALAASTGPVMSAMFLCTCVAMIFAMFGVNLFGARSPEYFQTFLRAMYTLFQVATEGTVISRDIMETENLEYDVSIYFVLFVTFEVFILLPVVVAVLLESFGIAKHRFREQEEKQRLLKNSSENMYVLDPLLESLMSHTSDQDLTSKLIFLFQKFDVDDDQIIDFQEFYEGLHKLSFTPQIKLTLREYEHIAGGHFVSKDCPSIDFRAFSSIVREQLKFYVQRRIGDLIGSVMDDNRQEALKLFAFKLLIHEVEMFVTADGGGFGGQNWETGAVFELNEDEKKAIKDVTSKHKLRKIAKRLWNKRTCLAFAQWRKAAGFPLDMENGIPAGGFSYSEKRRLTHSGGSQRETECQKTDFLRAGESSRSLGGGGGRGEFSGADRDGKVLVALQGIQATVDNLSERFSRFEKEREAERQTNSSAWQTSIRVDILSQRFSEYEKEREAERQQAQPGKQLPDAFGQARTGNARAGDDRQREGGSGKSGGEKEQAPAVSPGRSFPFRANAAHRQVTQRQSQTPPSSEQEVEAKTPKNLSSLRQKPSNGSFREKSHLWASTGDSPVPMAVSASVGAIHVVPGGQGMSSLIGNYGSGGGVMQDYMAAGPCAEYFGNGEDRDSKVSLGPRGVPLDPRMVEPSDVGHVLPPMGSKGVGGSPDNTDSPGACVITRNRWQRGGWGRDRMHHDAEHDSSHPPPFVHSYPPKRQIPQIGRGYLQLRRSQTASSLTRPILLSHSQQLKRQGGQDAEAAGRPALEYVLRDIIHVPEGRGVGSGTAAEAGSNMVPEERLKTHPFANPSMSPPRSTAVDLAKQMIRARSNRSETSSALTRSSIAW
jgi:voltage-gated sodium channel